jgi:hypothetical protein
MRDKSVIGVPVRDGTREETRCNDCRGYTFSTRTSLYVTGRRRRRRRPLGGGGGGGGEEETQEEVDEEEDGRRIMEKYKSPKALGGEIHLRWVLLQKPKCTPLLLKNKTNICRGREM